MKILVFTSLFPNNVFPMQGVFIKERMLSYAAQTKHSIKVVAPIPYFPPLRFGWRWRLRHVEHREVQEGIEVFHPRYVMTPKIGMIFYGLLMFLSVFREVKRIQRGFDFDLIDAHFVYPDGFAAILLGYVLGKPVTVSARGSDINLYKEKPLIVPLLRFALCKADKVIAVSQALKEAIVSLRVPEERVCVVPNGVDQRKFTVRPKSDARRVTRVGSGSVILSVGHLTANKGFDLLIEAMRLLSGAQGCKDVMLYIVGEGIYRSHLEGLIASLDMSNHVRLVGAVDHEQLAAWYNSADVFCLASGREGWPNVVMEALACGVPVVATAVGGIPEILTSDEVGLLTARNPEDIARTLDAALRREWNPTRIRQGVEAYSWESVAERVEKVFHSAVSRKNDGMFLA